jgi:hypothetical protein
MDWASSEWGTAAASSCSSNREAVRTQNPGAWPTSHLGGGGGDVGRISQYQDRRRVRQCNAICYIGVVGPLGEDGASAASCVLVVLVPAARRAFSQHLSCRDQPPQPNAAVCPPMPPLSCPYRRFPAPTPPCVFRSPALSSAPLTAHVKAGCVWCFCRPLVLFSAIAPSMLSIIAPLSVSSCSCSPPFQFCPTHWWHWV